MRLGLGVGRDGRGRGFRVAVLEVVGGAVKDVAVFEGADVAEALPRVHVGHLAGQTFSLEEVPEDEELEVLTDVESGGLVGDEV